MRRLSQDIGPRLSSLAEALGPISQAGAAPSASDPAERLRHEREQAFESARRDGLAKGLADAEAEIARRVDHVASRLRSEHEAAMDQLGTRSEAMAQLANGLSSALAGQARDAEEVAVEAAFAALLRVLGDKAADRRLMRELCQQALASRGAGMATLRLSPDDHAGLELDAVDLQVIADPVLQPGQCILESARGASETGLDVRLEAMKRAFLDGLSSHRRGR